MGLSMNRIFEVLGKNKKLHARTMLHAISVLATRTVNPGTGEFSSAGTCKKYRRTVDSGTASNRKIMKNMTYRVLDPGFTMHA